MITQYVGENTRQIPDWQIIMQGTAGRLGKRIPMEAFTFLGNTERPMIAAALYHLDAQPLVIWREKICKVRTKGRKVYSVMEWRETVLYFIPSRPHLLYLVRDGKAYRVITGAETRRMIAKAHRAVMA